MLPKLLVIFLLIIGIGFGGYKAYDSFYLSPEKIVARASESISQLKTVHADMDITTNMRVTNEQGASVTQQTKITGLSDLDLQDKTQKTHMTIQVGNNSLEMDMILLKDGEMYMKMPILGKGWISVNTKTFKEQGSLPIDPQSNDYISQSLGFLKSVKPGSIVKLEDEVVDGVKTSRYRVDISTVQYLEYLRQLTGNNDLAEAFKDANVKSDLWVDKKTNYVVKMESDIKNFKVLDPKTKNTLGSVDMVMRINYSKYNQPVNIGKPEGEIVSYEELLKQAQQQQGQR